MKKQGRRIREPIVAVANNPVEGEGLVEALQQLPMERIIQPGNQVVIVPNWVKSLPPETGTVVGPETLRVLIKHIKTFLPARIVIAAGSGGQPTPQVLKEQGFDKIINEEQVEFVDLNYGPFVELSLDNCECEKTPLNTLVEEMDVLISFTQIKVHREATVSLGIKNMALSWPPAEVHGYPKTQLGIHEQLHEFIVEMAKHIPIDLTILSGDQAMVGTGPSGGKPVNSDIVIAGTDPVATDVVGARLLGFLPQAVRYLWLLGRAGVGEMDLNKVELKGVPLNVAESVFSQSAYGYNIVVDDKELLPPHAK